MCYGCIRAAWATLVRPVTPFGSCFRSERRPAWWSLGKLCKRKRKKVRTIGRPCSSKASARRGGDRLWRTISWLPQMPHMLPRIPPCVAQLQCHFSLGALTKIPDITYSYQKVFLNMFSQSSRVQYNQKMQVFCSLQCVPRLSMVDWAISVVSIWVLTIVWDVKSLFGRWPMKSKMSTTIQ